MESLVNKLREELKNLDRTTLFSSTDKYDELISVCKDILMEKGYKIRQPVDHMYNVKTVGDLGILFYKLLSDKDPEIVLAYKNHARDMTTLRRFVDSRHAQGGISYTEAIRECADIIHVVFEHESEFNFKFPMSVSMFGQKNCGWITEKAINILNSGRKKKEEEDHLKRLDEMAAAYEGKIGMFDEDELDSML